MKTSFRAGVLIIAIATGAGLAVPLAGPASALAPSVACAKVNAPPIVGGKLASTYASCTPAALAAGGNAVVAVSKTGPTKGKLVQTITWKGGKGTTKALVKYANAPTLGKCKAPTKRVAITGTVSSATGAAAKITKTGETLSGSVCSIQSGAKVGQTYIEPGTKFKL